MQARTGLGALGDLDLQLVGVHQELRRHTKPAGSDLHTTSRDW